MRTRTHTHTDTHRHTATRTCTHTHRHTHTHVEELAAAQFPFSFAFAARRGRRRGARSQDAHPPSGAPTSAGLGLALAAGPAGSDAHGSWAAMAPYRIRPYEDSDYAAVRALFARGMMEHAPTTYRHLLSSPVAQLFFLGLFLAVLAASGSLLLALGALLLALAGGWWHLHSLWAQYVRQSLGSDLLDIRGTYLEAVDSCLWVAEADGAVLGMVAAVPPEEPSERGTALEMKRMSVGREHRGRGIARALCGTVLHFARERGYGAVVLSTSLAQRAAQQLYESVGFQKLSEYFPSRLAQLLRFTVFRYRYELPGSG